MKPDRHIYFCLKSSKHLVTTIKFNIINKLFLLAFFILFLVLTGHASVFTVTKITDTNDGLCNADCSLREAVAAANSVQTDDEINFDPSIFSVPQIITLNGNELLINNRGALTINGTGIDNLTISANNLSRVFKTDIGSRVSMNNLSVSGGFANQAGGIYNSGNLTLISCKINGNKASFIGGGIYNQGQISSLTIKNSIISNNLSTDSDGAGITNDGTLDISFSTINSNTASRYGGGLIIRGGPVTLNNVAITANNAYSGGGISHSTQQITTIKNSLIANNTAHVYGGGIENNGGLLNIANSTISSNKTTVSLGAGLAVRASTTNLDYVTIAFNNSMMSGGGGVFQESGVVNAHSTIIASNTAAIPGADFRGTINSQGYNLIGTTDMTTVTGNTAGNLLNVNPLLGSLTDNGGFTFSHNLSTGSPAIDAADGSNYPFEDQRTAYRALDGDANESRIPDIGATEAGARTVTKTADTNDGICNADCSLREALSEANASAGYDSIIFSGLFNLPRTITLTGGELPINNSGNLYLNGTIPNLLTISGNDVNRIFRLNSGANATFSRLNIDSGREDFSNGGGIYLSIASLTISDSEIRNCRASNGGGIHNEGGALTIINTKFKTNSGRTGGGAISNITSGQNTAFLILADSLLMGNTSESGGGAIRNTFGNVAVNNSLITENTVTGSSSDGGGIYNQGQMTVSNSNITRNTTTGSGGGIRTISSDNNLAVNNTGFSDNQASIGGAIRSDSGIANIKDCSFYANQASFRGGAILSNGGNVGIENSVFYSNISSDDGGAIANFAVMNLINSTISGNITTDQGGGIYNGATLSIKASTIAFNKAAFGGGLYNNSSIEAGNTIFANNLNNSNAANDFLGTLNSLGFNLVRSTNLMTITGTTEGNILGSDPQLLPLANYGGSTLTHALKKNSLAIDRGKSFGVNTDQRNLTRPFEYPSLPNPSGGDGTDIGAFERRPGDVNIPTSFDFDSDGKAEVSVFRPSVGAWYLNQTAAGFSAISFGISTDKVVPADYDGDGKTDLGVFRDGNWYLLRSTAGFTAVSFGQAGDIPVPDDFDGDGKAEVAVYRNGNWYILNLDSNQFSAVSFGNSTDKPLTGDFDGDGKADQAVFRPTEGYWYLNTSSQGVKAVSFGISTDKIVPADYDGDGKTDIAVYRDGNWYRLNSSNNQFVAVQFGLANDLTVPADYDGDGKADVAVFRNGNWYILQSTNGFTAQAFGQTGDLPIPSVFVR